MKQSPPGPAPPAAGRSLTGWLTALVGLLLLALLVWLWADRLPLIIERLRGLVAFFRSHPGGERLFGASGWILALAVLAIAALASLGLAVRLLVGALRALLPGARALADEPGTLADARARRQLLHEQALALVSAAAGGAGRALPWARPARFRRTPGEVDALSATLPAAIVRTVAAGFILALLFVAAPFIASKAQLGAIHPLFPSEAVLACTLPVAGLLGLLFLLSRRAPGLTVAERVVRFATRGNPAGLFHFAATSERPAAAGAAPAVPVETVPPELGRVRAGEAGSFSGQLVLESPPSPTPTPHFWAGWPVLLCGAVLLGVGLWLVVKSPFVSSARPGVHVALLLDLAQRVLAGWLCWRTGRQLYDHGVRLLRRRVYRSDLYELEGQGTWTALAVGAGSERAAPGLDIQVDVHLTARAARVTSERSLLGPARTLLAAESPPDLQAALDRGLATLARWTGPAGGMPADRSRALFCTGCGAAVPAGQANCAHCGRPV